MAAIAVAVVLGCAAIGSAIGAGLRRGVDRTPLRGIDRFFGGVFGVIATALALSLMATTITATGAPIISSAVASSRVLTAIDDLTPEPVDAGIAQLRGLVIAEGLPRLGELLDQEVAPTSTPVSLDDPELQHASASVARVSGNAFACGTAVTGSGFVAAEDLIVTNAHVLAGVDTPLIELPGREPREGRVVYFDPIDDLAVVEVDRLGVSALPVIPPIAAGTATVVQGYPLGGPFTNTPAHVLSVGTAPVPDIYDASVNPREVYSLEADVQPGNSGGPLLTGGGEVAGVVFARGADGADRGYAISTTELLPVLAQVSPSAASVSTGTCTR